MRKVIEMVNKEEMKREMEDSILYAEILNDECLYHSSTLRISNLLGIPEGEYKKILSSLESE